MSKIKTVFAWLKRKKEIIKVIGFVASIAIAVTVFINFFYSPTVVVGDSMYPALNASDVVLVDMIGDDYSKIERFDIVVFPYKYNINTSVIKRVIGLPGDLIEVKDNKIYINDEELMEHYGYYDKEFQSHYDNVEAVKLAYNEYFVIGDNRNVSDDSRNPEIGVITQDEIIGIACFRVWPLNSFGSLSNQ